MVSAIWPSLREAVAGSPGRRGDTWLLDEMFVPISGERHYLWRAVDQDGEMLDILAQKRRNKTRRQTLLSQVAEKAAICPSYAGDRAARQLWGSTQGDPL